MKEHPIIFSTEMVKAILDGSKTQTRRVIKLLDFQPSTDSYYDWQFRTKSGLWHPLTNKELLERCPYGQVGDRLWVRETWRTNAIGGISYKADEGSSWIGKWKPSIHMFRKDSRITLEITEVRVERVQEIEPRDCHYEGIEMIDWGFKNYSGGKIYASPVTSFKSLWDSLNAKKYPWSSDSWVWVLSFKKVEGSDAYQK